MKITKSKLKQIIKEELSAAMSDGDPDGDSDDAAELRDMADQLEGGSKHVYVLYRTKGHRDPVLWGIYSSKENVEKWIENESAAAADLGVEFNKGDYSYGKRVLDPSDHPGVDKGK